MEENKRICSECGAILTDEGRELEGRLLCGTCFDERTVECENCGTRIWSDDAEGNEHTILCSYCFDHYYTNCENCGRLIHNDDAYYEGEDDDYPYCYNCFHDIQGRPIKNYNYKPEPIFYGTGPLYLGIELELDEGGEEDSNAEALIKLANKDEDRIYIKHDGSLCQGLEMVSQPMDLEYHINCMNWKPLMERAISMGYRSHQTSTCGYHIHVSRSAFGKDFEEQDQAIGRVVFFIEKHWNEMVRISRRTTENINRWAARYATISGTTEETYKKAKDKRMGRYCALNLEPCKTIEFRLFRGTLRYQTFIAMLQLVSEICCCAINMTDKEFEDMSWSDFVARIPCKNAELIEYLKSKRLYVNDVETEGGEF